MSRDRVPTRPADPGPTDESDDDDESESDDSATRRRRRSDQAGDVRDLRRQQVGQGARETALGSSTNLRIAPEFDPGFVDTEFINRIAFTDSFQFLWDTERGHWRPLTEKDLAGSAFSSGLLEDTIETALGNVVSPDSGTEVDGNGNLRLGDGTIGISATDGARKTTQTESFTSGIEWDANNDSDVLYVDWEYSGTPPAEQRIYDVTAGVLLYREPWRDGLAEYNVSIVGGNTYTVLAVQDTGDYDVRFYSQVQLPVDAGDGTLTRGVDGPDYYSDRWWTVSAIGTTPPSESGKASTTFNSPTRSTAYDMALYNQQLNGGSVQVDLYSGDPNSPDSTLLKQDIQERTDLSDVNPQRSDLQYKITMERADDGSSPLVETAGYQYQK
jgi:hypothetical protein